MKPVHPIYLRGGGCRVLLCGYNIYAGVRLSRFSTCSGSIYGIFSAALQRCVTFGIHCISSVLRRDAADVILKTGLLARLFCIKVVLFRAVAQRLYINQQNTRLGTFAVLDLAEVNGIALILLQRQRTDIL